MPHRARVTDVQVDGVPFETFSEDGVFFIRVGSEDETVTGTQVYTLHYSYDFGADRVPEYDEFIYSPAWGKLGSAHSESKLACAV